MRSNTVNLIIQDWNGKELASYWYKRDFSSYYEHSYRTIRASESEALEKQKKYLAQSSQVNLYDAEPVQMQENSKSENFETNPVRNNQNEINLELANPTNLEIQFEDEKDDNVKNLEEVEKNQFVFKTVNLLNSGISEMQENLKTENSAIATNEQSTFSHQQEQLKPSKNVGFKDWLMEQVINTAVDWFL